MKKPCGPITTFIVKTAEKQGKCVEDLGSVMTDLRAEVVPEGEERNQRLGQMMSEV